MRGCLSVGSPTRAPARVLASLALFGLTAACGAPERSGGELSQAIVGGERTEAGAWPSVGWLDNGCTGVLIAPDLVIYAGHCGARATTVSFGDELEIVVDELAGTARVVAPEGARHVTLRDCRVHPDTTLGHGTDLGYCWLSEPALAAEMLPPIALGCARAQVSAGMPLTLVGFGVEASGLSSLGTKRSVVADVVSVGSEFEIGDDEHGTCSGDSGGPAFVSAVADNQRREWSLVGILSSGEQGSLCGVGYYTDLARMVPWLESETARDLTPCFEGSTWQPQAGCARASLDDRGLPEGDPSEPSRLCREPFTRPRGGCTLSPVLPAQRGANAVWLLAMLVVVARRLRNG